MIIEIIESFLLLQATVENQVCLRTSTSLSCINEIFLGVSGRDGLPGVPGGKGFGKYTQFVFGSSSILILCFFQMVLQVYQVEQV